MHHIYKTCGIILSSTPLGDSGKSLKILTPDYGLMRLQAQAVRKLESKLRQSIQDFSISEITFVRGKTGNRLTGATLIENLYEIFDQETFLVFVRIFKLLEKMIIDEENDVNIYQNIEESINFLKTEGKINLKAFEIILVLKLLNNLGYLENRKKIEIFTNNMFSLDLIEKFNSNFQKEGVGLINQAIKASHL